MTPESGEKREGEMVTVQECKDFPGTFRVRMGEYRGGWVGQKIAQREADDLKDALSPLLRRAELADKLGEALRARKEGGMLTTAAEDEALTAWDAIKGDGDA